MASPSLVSNARGGSVNPVPGGLAKRRLRHAAIVAALASVAAACSFGGRSASSADDSAPPTQAPPPAFGQGPADAAVDPAGAPLLPTDTTTVAEADFGQDGAVRTRVTESGYVVTDLGCLADLSTPTLDTALSGRMGPLLGWDNAHVYPLGGDRHLWLMHDAFFDYRGDATRLVETVAVHNAAMLQSGTCLTLIHQGNAAAPSSFERGDGEDDRRWFWPLGGELHDGRLQVFWAETVAEPVEGRRFDDGIARQPVATWLATYDATTLERLDFQPAPNAGITPQYGFAVASDETHSYLFGNSNMLDLRPAGGFHAGPHSGTRMYLARVPRGQLGASPEYRTADGWSPDAAAATAFSERFWTENAMQPRYIDGSWVSITKTDGFWGSEIVIDVAAEPWAWSTVAQFEHEPRFGRERSNSYQPILLPWRDDGALTAVISENGIPWQAAVDDPSLYRLRAIDVEWPAPPP